MRSLPYVIRPRMLSELLIWLEVGLLVFWYPGIAGVVRDYSSWWKVCLDLVFVVPALIAPIWWWSRRLRVTTNGVEYSPWFCLTTRIPYGEIQTIQIEGRRVQERGTSVMIYHLSILSSGSHTIRITMHYYRTAELRDVVETILAHAGRVGLKGLAKRLLDGSETFTRYRRRG